MRAVVFDRPGDEGVMYVRDVPPPILRAGCIRIGVAATAVNRADLLQRRGLYPPPPGASEILGLECAGRVIEMGERTSGWQVGERVMALLPGGGYAEEAVVEAGCAWRVPDALTLEEAAALPETFLTVYLTVFVLGKLQPGGTVLVHGGGGGIGTAAITLGTIAGAGVIVTAGSEDKCRRCLEHGAVMAINYRREDFVAAVRLATAGRGVDVVLDAVGGPYLNRDLEALAPGGVLVVIGAMGGREATVDTATLLRKRLSIIGSTLRARPAEEKGELVGKFLARFGGELSAGRIRPVVSTILPLEDVAAAHQLVAANAHFGKVVLRVAGSSNG